jgi:aspartyl-tRNA(Asn)/glutamyl-tRNA(Gln) amidotransferase subunit A
MCDRFAELFRRVDLLATPTTCVAAFPIEASTVAVRDARTGRDVHVAAAAILLRLTSPANLVGVPAISVPAGLTSDGLPFGLQLHARPFEEGLLLSAAHAYEQARATS